MPQILFDIYMSTNPRMLWTDSFQIHISKRIIKSPFWFYENSEILELDKLVTFLKFLEDI